MREKLKILKIAFPHTIPVLTGFTLLGIAYGILMNSKGYGIGWTTLASLIVFGGSGQYVAITFLTSAFNPVQALLMTVMVNARHLFYGISMLEEYKNAGKLKPYLIFGLCDETFSIICSTESTEEIDKNLFNFAITFLNHLYWVFGSFLGAFLGSIFSFNTRGLDFVLTSLFVSIFIGQWKNKKDHRPAIVGVVVSSIYLIIFGQDRFIIPSMIAIVIILTVLEEIEKYKKRIEGKGL